MVRLDKLLNEDEFDLLNTAITEVAPIVAEWLEENKKVYNGARKMRKQLEGKPDLEGPNNLLIVGDASQNKDIEDDLAMVSDPEDIQEIRKKYPTMEMAEVLEKANAFITKYRGMESFIASLPRIERKFSIISENKSKVFNETTEESGQEGTGSGEEAQ